MSKYSEESRNWLGLVSRFGGFAVTMGASAAASYAGLETGAAREFMAATAAGHVAPVDPAFRIANNRSMPAIMEAPATVRAPKALMWTRDDCDRLEGMGLLPERWELVDGEIISKMGQNLPHAWWILEVAVWLRSVFGKLSVVTQSSIDVAPEDNPTSKPEPDVVVLSRPWIEMNHNPTPREIVLLVEVSDTTLAFDLTVKAGLYARAGIPEYWVLDVNSRRLHQFREPRPEGYSQRAEFDADAPISPLDRAESFTLTWLAE